MSEIEMPRTRSSGLSWIGLHGKRHAYETGVKGHFKNHRVVAETQCFQGSGCSWKLLHLIPLVAKAESRLHLVTPRFCAY